jgi:L-seryl-tRNA(Ser) seleniumtransferase
VSFEPISGKTVSKQAAVSTKTASRKNASAPIESDLLRALPSIDDVLNTPCVQELTASVPRNVVADCARDVLDAFRQKILARKTDAESPSNNTRQSLLFDIANATRSAVVALHKPSLRSVINATGVIVHTNLGRSVLAEVATKSLLEVAQNYSTLEFDIENGERGSRHSHCEKLLCNLTGAEGALIVNNNAAAVLMVLTEFAAKREVIVSRGELIEIGGSFRIPDIMGLSHAELVEVGTTNKTHIQDYQSAITCKTALLLKVHPSNFRMIGFTEDVSIKDLRALALDAHKKADLGADKNANQDIVVYHDQGSGALLELECFETYGEPTIARSLAEGSDLVSFSGDKLLGGPQAGIIVGRKDYIERLKKNPLARAMRIDKLCLAALEATLTLYLYPERALREIPTLRMLTLEKAQMSEYAQQLKQMLEAEIPSQCATVSVVSETSFAGGGALPECALETRALRIDFLQGRAQEAQDFLRKRSGKPVIVRIKKEAVLLDVRTIQGTSELTETAKALGEYFAKFKMV